MGSPASAIPDFQSLMLPVLNLARTGEVRIGAAVEALADQFQLSPSDRSHLLPSGTQTTFANRVHWAKSYLSRAGLVTPTRRGHFVISEKGRAVLASPPERITVSFLKEFPAFTETGYFSTTPALEQLQSDVTDSLTPDEEMRRARDRIEADLASEMLQKISAAPPAFFEQLVVKLVTAMGYGGSIEDAGRALGRAGDGGVDGVIDEDALGLDRIYVQAKRYQEGRPVGPGEIRDFFGALDQFKAGKGLFVTTSSFSKSAEQTAAGLSKRIVLVDGARLAQLMIRYDVGCRIEEQLYIKRIDEDFFSA